MSLLACAVCVARCFTSLATTAKPFPASPARAASMVALSASRFVWSANFAIRRTTSPISSLESLRPFMICMASSDFSAAVRATSTAW